ncbi:MAG: molybdopterin-dependent oxidoreductase, partial [Aridibacter sp.]
MEKENIEEAEKNNEKDLLEIEEKPLETEDEGKNEKIVQEFRSISRRNFLGFGIGGLLAGGAYYWLRSAPMIGELESPLRHTLQFNEAIAETYFSHSRLAPEYAKSAVEPLRVNGSIGLSDEFDAGNWNLQISGTQKSPQTSLQFSLEDIKKLPKQNIAINFKCIEGWSRIMNYVGARFSDFIGQNKLFNANNLPEYVSLATPDGEYYVGLDMESALHPQTLLCY